MRGSTKRFFSVGQLNQIQQLWQGQRSAPSVQLMRSLWSTAVQHRADNILSQPPDDTASSSKRDSSAGRWRIDEQCRKELIYFCRELDDRICREDQSDLTPQSAPTRSPALSEASSLPGLSGDGFPSSETLEASLDIYFQYFPFAFVHKATFEASATPSSILFPMCLIGLASLYAERSKVFVVRYLKVGSRTENICFPRFVAMCLPGVQKMMRFCRSDLSSKALGHCEPWSLLISIASTLLTSYLALGFLVCATYIPSKSTPLTWTKRMRSNKVRRTCFALKCCR